MFILETPYISPETINYLAETHTPVLSNPAAQNHPDAHRLALTESADAARRVNAGERLYTISENALSWVRANVTNPAILQGVDAMKDKAALREALRPLYPNYFFQRVRVDDLAAVDPRALPLPVVLKPSVGFFSVGVHVIPDAAAWTAAVAAIVSQRAQWSERFADSVVGAGEFIIEGFITGDEYAVDVYYDNNGRAVVVNIMRHDFTGDTDVSDRLYYTSASIVRTRLAAFTDYFNRVGAILNLRDFPAHVEIRLTADGEIIPIEFNPLRFAGLCTTELSLFAYGFRTYDYYLNDRTPDWDALLRGRDHDIYSMIILDKPRGLAPTARFDYGAVAASVTETLLMRRYDGPELPIFGFLFARTPEENRAELDRLMHSDLREFTTA